MRLNTRLKKLEGQIDRVDPPPRCPECRGWGLLELPAGELWDQVGRTGRCPECGGRIVFLLPPLDGETGPRPAG